MCGEWMILPGAALMPGSKQDEKYSRQYLIDARCAAWPAGMAAVYLHTTYSLDLRLDLR